MKTTNENIRSQRCWQYRLWFGKDWFLHYFRRFSVTVPGSRISMKWTLRSSRTRPTGSRPGGGSSWATLDWRRSSQRYALLSLHGAVGTTGKANRRRDALIGQKLGDRELKSLYSHPEADTVNSFSQSISVTCYWRMAIALKPYLHHLVNTWLTINKPTGSFFNQRVSCLANWWRLHPRPRPTEESSGVRGRRFPHPWCRQSQTSGYNGTTI